MVEAPEENDLVYMADQPSDEMRIWPREFLRAAEVRYAADPELVVRIHDARSYVASLEALAVHWRQDRLEDVRFGPGILPPLRVRCFSLGVLMGLRDAELADGIAREVDADALFPAAAIARSLLELVGVSSYARTEIPRLRAADIAGLARVTQRLLIGSRALADQGMPSGFTIPTFINAAKAQFGDHLGEDYGHLSDLAHPNLLARGAVDWRGEITFERQGIDTAEAELLIKVCGNAAGLIAHNAQRLVEWADVESNDCNFSPSGQE